MPLAQLERAAIAPPPRLEALCLRVHLPDFVRFVLPGSAEETLSVRWLERLVPALPASLRTLALHFLRESDYRVYPPDAALPLLSRVASLTELDIAARWGDEPVRVLYRGMLHLRRLVLVEEDCRHSVVPIPWSAKELEQLTRGTCGVDFPALESLGAMDSICPALLPLLLRLPSLTELRP